MTQKIHLLKPTRERGPERTYCGRIISVEGKQFLVFYDTEGEELLAVRPENQLQGPTCDRCRHLAYRRIDSLKKASALGFRP